METGEGTRTGVTIPRLSESRTWLDTFSFNRVKDAMGFGEFKPPETGVPDRTADTAAE